jgi:hypothetical protein
MILGYEALILPRGFSNTDARQTGKSLLHIQDGLLMI